MKRDPVACTHCGSTLTTIKETLPDGRKRYRCKDCKKASTWPLAEGGDSGIKYATTFLDNKDKGTGIITSRIAQHMTEEELIAFFKIDTEIWEIVSIEYGQHEGYRKDRTVEWRVVNGVVVNGEVHDTGKLRIEPLLSVKINLRRKKTEQTYRHVFEEIKSDALKHAVKYPKIKYPKRKEGLIYEIDMPDLHFGKLAWAEETGEDYDIKIAETMAKDALSSLLAYVQNQPISKILLPIGNDLFNVNSASETTVAGTKQQEDTRWGKTFRMCRQLLVNLIEVSSTLAPVDVVVVPGNHDRERVFYLGDALECWFDRNPNVSINNKASTRKYVHFGKNMILFTHGSDEKMDQLPSIMAYEEPVLWGNSINRECHIGHLHHKRTLTQNVLENQGVVIRVIRSLSPADDWTYRSGFVGAKRAAEGFLWHDHDGVVAQFTSRTK